MFVVVGRQFPSSLITAVKEEVCMIGGMSGERAMHMIGRTGRRKHTGNSKLCRYREADETGLQGVLKVWPIHGRGRCIGKGGNQ